MMNKAPWFIPNTVMLRDLQTPTVKEKIRGFSSQYGVRLSAHPNDLAVNLMTPPNDYEDIYHTICIPDYYNYRFQ
jgi:hypothetical protein